YKSEIISIREWAETGKEEAGTSSKRALSFLVEINLHSINYVSRILHSLPPASPPVTTSSCSAFIGSTVAGILSVDDEAKDRQSTIVYVGVFLSISRGDAIVDK
ncbi:hypothetical protein Droror1_Dr00028216, partial [Drosera rotundifolia]